MNKIRCTKADKIRYFDSACLRLRELKETYKIKNNFDNCKRRK